mmetsp:Transcript_10545/g.26793  ORF Transcript_10545/g.26793 Transcript_10545/m.26793 type:complete len:402 (-) Transcript_10545:116-1321(-)
MPPTTGVRRPMQRHLQRFLANVLQLLKGINLNTGVLEHLVVPLVARLDGGRQRCALLVPQILLQQLRVRAQLGAGRLRVRHALLEQLLLGLEGRLAVQLLRRELRLHHQHHLLRAQPLRLLRPLVDRHPDRVGDIVQMLLRLLLLLHCVLQLLPQQLILHRLLLASLHLRHLALVLILSAAEPGAVLLLPVPCRHVGLQPGGALPDVLLHRLHLFPHVRFGLELAQHCGLAAPQQEAVRLDHLVPERGGTRLAGRAAVPHVVDGVVDDVLPRGPHIPHARHARDHRQCVRPVAAVRRLPGVLRQAVRRLVLRPPPPQLLQLAVQPREVLRDRGVHRLGQRAPGVGVRAAQRLLPILLQRCPSRQPGCLAPEGQHQERRCCHHRQPCRMPPCTCRLRRPALL